MFGAFLYLTRQSALNRFTRQLKRVRSPRYALALLFGVLYIWFMVSGRGSPTGGGPLSYLVSDTGLQVATVLVFLFLAWPWTFGARTDALAFTPAELHFLVPAPVSRRGLISYKLLRSQIAVLISTVIWVVLIRRSSSELSPLLRALGLWAVFSIFALHRLGASLFRASIVQHGVAGLRRQRVATLVVVSLLLLLGYAVFDAWNAIAASPTTDQRPFAQIGQMLSQPLLHAVLAPFRAIAAPAIVDSTAAWLAAFPYALGILALHFAWVISTNVAFEESAAEASARLAKRIADFKARGIRGSSPPTSKIAQRLSLPLPSGGHAAVAIVWKNLLAALRGLRMASLIPIAMILVASLAMGVLDSSAPRIFAMMMVGMILIMSLLFGPRFIRNDLRTDLAQLSLLKTYPVSSRSIVGAEVASATIALTIVQSLLLVVMYLLGLNSNYDVIGAFDRTLLLLTLPLVLATLNSVNMAIQNGAALMFPAWMSIGAIRPSGIEALGQNLLLAVASLLLLAAALVPGVIAGGITFIALSGLPMRLRITAVAIAGLSVLVVEVVTLVASLGKLFDRTDPTAVS